MIDLSINDDLYPAMIWSANSYISYGLYWSSKSPIPNYPHSPHPHVYTFFNDDKHMQCFNPHSTYMILSFNDIFYGYTLLHVSSNPN